MDGCWIEGLFDTGSTVKPRHKHHLGGRFSKVMLMASSYQDYLKNNLVKRKGTSIRAPLSPFRAPPVNFRNTANQKVRIVTAVIVLYIHTLYPIVCMYVHTYTTLQRNVID